MKVAQATSISTHPTLTDGLFSYHKFEDNGLDSHASNDLTLTNITYTASGHIDKGAVFNGTDSQAELGTSSAILNVPAFSINFTINPNSITDKAYFSNYNGGSYSAGEIEIRVLHFAYFTYGAGLLLVGGLGSGGGSAAQYLFDTHLTIGTKATVGVAIDTGESGLDIVKVFVDGVEITTKSLNAGSAFAGNMGNIGQSLQWGNSNLITNSCDAMFDEALLTLRALTAAEFADLHNSGAGLPYD